MRNRRDPEKRRSLFPFEKYRIENASSLGMKRILNSKVGRFAAGEGSPQVRKH
jgi:hypothetical protein